MSNPLRLGLAVLLGVGGLFGCSQAGPTTAPAQTGDRNVLSTTEALSPDKLFTDDGKLIVNGKPMAFEDVTAQLPKRISEKDAAKMLVRIDKENVNQDEGKYSVNAIIYGGRGGWGRYYSRGYYPGYANYYGSYYYPYGNYYFPYTYNAGYYYPYTYSTVYPYTYSSVYPYSAYSSYYPFYAGSGLTGLYSLYPYYYRRW